MRARVKPSVGTTLAALITPSIGDDVVLGFPSEEERLLRAARLGDREAAETLIERTYSTVYAVLYRMTGGNADLAADLTQETYQKAWQSIGRFEGRSKVSTWLFRIAYTTFVSHVRRGNHTQPLDEPVLDRLRDASVPADDMISQSEQSDRLRDAVLALPEDLRLTVTAHFWGELPVREIARMEKITTVAIRKRLHKAFGLLETVLAEGARP